MENPENGSKFVQKSKMSRKIPPIDENRLKSNPFTESLIIPVNERIDTVVTVPDENGKLVPMRTPMDAVKSTKVYHNAGDGDEALSLTAAGMRMYVYIIHKMESATDWIRIMPENYAAKAERCSMKSYKRAVDELIDKKYICTSPFKYTYYINPKKLFCGSRIIKYPNNLMYKKPWKGTDQKPKKKEPVMPLNEPTGPENNPM